MERSGRRPVVSVPPKMLDTARMTIAKHDVAIAVGLELE
jgi:hypothetical protein